MTELRETRPGGILLDEQRRKALSYVPKDDVDAFATLYWEADDMDCIKTKVDAWCRENGLPPVPDFSFLRRWVDEQLNIGQSRDGWRSNQVLDAHRANQEEKEKMERYMSPEYRGEARGWGK